MESYNYNLTVVSLVGRQGSGKTTISTKLAQRFHTACIETSKVVKFVTKIDDKKKLHRTAARTLENPDWLGREIAAVIRMHLKQPGAKKVLILSGARETQVHDYLRKLDINLIVIEVAAEPELRYTRLMDIGKFQSPREFLDLDLKERAMGLGKMLKSIDHRIMTTADSNPDNIANATKKYLISKGVKASNWS